MTLKEILELPRREALKNHIEVLDKAYYELANRHFCRVCPTDVSTMFNELKIKHMDNNNFRFAKEKGIFRWLQEDGSSIMLKNDTLDDDTALAFLSENPERITYFSTYPKNWKELIGFEEEVEAPCVECRREEFNAMKLSELKEAFPEVVVDFGQKKADFIDKIMIHLINQG